MNDARLLAGGRIPRAAGGVRYLTPGATECSVGTVGLGLCWKSGVAEVIGINSAASGRCTCKDTSTAELLAWTV
ncbi:MAG: hypothetical protein ACLR7U_03865 [Ruthenibacterium lactatiformans]